MIEMLNNIADKWFTWEVAIFWQVGVLIAIVFLVDLLIKKWAWPQLRYALWMLILVKLILPPSLTSPTSFTAEIPALAEKVVTVEVNKPELVQKPEQLLEVDRGSEVSSAAAVGPVEFDKPVINESEAVHTAAVVDGSGDPTVADHDLQALKGVDDPGLGLSWKGYLFLVWLTGVFVLSAWLMIRLTGLRHEYLNDKQQSKLPERFGDLLGDVANRLGVKKTPKVILTDKVCCPAVFGIFQPILLMPADKLKNLTRDDLEHILLHELAHIKRGDLVVHACYMILQIAYWFNPLIWLIRKQLQNLRELCCDATVAKLLREKTLGYRETLLETARQLLAEPVDPGMGLLGLFENSSWLVERLKWLERKTWERRGLRIATIVVLIGLMTACVLPMAKAVEEKIIRRVEVPVTKVWLSDIAGEDIEVLEMASGEIIKYEKVKNEHELLHKTRGDILCHYEAELQKPKITFLRGANIGKQRDYDHITLTTIPIEMPYKEEVTTVEGCKYLVSCSQYDAEKCVLEYEPINGQAKRAMARAEKNDNKQDDDSQADTFKATLANGVTVELVAVRKHPKGKQWWRPDGSLLEASLYDRLYQTMGKDDDLWRYEAAIRFSGGEDVKLHYHHSKGMSSSTGVIMPYLKQSEPIRDMGVVIFDCDGNRDAVDICVAAASGKWVKRDEFKNDKLGHSHTVSSKEFGCSWTEATETDGITEIVVSHNLTDHQYRIAAYDKKDNLVVGQWKTRGKVDDVETSVVKFDMPMKKIKRVALETRVYEWVTFKNISLKPGVKSDVGVEIAGSAMVDVSDSIGRINLPVGTKGIVVAEHGDAVYGSDIKYSSLMYLGRVKKGQQIELVDNNVYYSQHTRPIVKVKVLNKLRAAVPAGTVGWVSLVDTDFYKAFEQKPDDQLPSHFKKLKKERRRGVVSNVLKLFSNKVSEEKAQSSKDEDVTVDISGVIGTVNLPIGTKGIVVAEHGDAVYGSDVKYSPMMYLGRVNKGQKIELVDRRVCYNKFSVPIVKVKVLKKLFAAVPARTVGWVSLAATDFYKGFEQKPDDQLPSHFKELKKQQHKEAMSNYKKYLKNKASGEKDQGGQSDGKVNSEANSVIQKVLARYSGMQSYSAEGQVISAMDNSDVMGNNKNIESGLNAQVFKHSFNIKLNKSGVYRIDWQQKVHADFSNTGSVWSTDGKEHFLLNGKRKSSPKDRQMALGAAAGISGGASHTIPSLFFGEQASLSQLKDAVLINEAVIDGEKCYVVSGKLSNVGFMYWISKDRFLIIQAQKIFDGKMDVPEVELSDEQWKEALEAVGEEVTEQNIQKFKASSKEARKQVPSFKGTITERHRNMKVTDSIEEAGFTHTLYIWGDEVNPLYLLEGKVYKDIEKVVAHIGKLSKLRPRANMLIRLEPESRSAMQDTLNQLIDLCVEAEFLVNKKFRYDLEELPEEYKMLVEAAKKSKDEVYVADGYSVDIPEVGKIELVSVCQFIGENRKSKKSCWKPDGSKLDKLIYSRSYHMRDLSKQFGFVFKSSKRRVETKLEKMDGLSDESRIISGHDICEGKRWRVDTDYFTHYGFDIDRDVVDFKLRIQPHNWKTIAEYDGRYAIGKLDDRIKFIESYASGGDFKVVFESDVDQDEFETKFTAVYYYSDKNGNRRSRTRTASIGSARNVEGKEMSVAFFGDVKLADVKSISFSIRPKEFIWAEFKDVCLKPALKSEFVAEGTSIEVDSRIYQKQDSLESAFEFANVPEDRRGFDFVSRAGQLANSEQLAILNKLFVANESRDVDLAKGILSEASKREVDNTKSESSILLENVGYGKLFLTGDGVRYFAVCREFTEKDNDRLKGRITFPDRPSHIITDFHFDRRRYMLMGERHYVVNDGGVYKLVCPTHMKPIEREAVKGEDNAPEEYGIVKFEENDDAYNQQNVWKYKWSVELDNEVGEGHSFEVLRISEVVSGDRELDPKIAIQKIIDKDMIEKYKYDGVRCGIYVGDTEPSYRFSSDGYKVSGWKCGFLIASSSVSKDMQFPGEGVVNIKVNKKGGFVGDDLELLGFETTEGDVRYEHKVILRKTVFDKTDKAVMGGFQQAIGDWGEMLLGLQCRVRPTKSEWKAGEKPTLVMDLRNEGDTLFSFLEIPKHHCEIEFDGEWYGSAEPHRDARILTLKPGDERYDAIEIKLSEFWRQPGKGRDYKPVISILRGKKLELASGKHTVRVRFRPKPWLREFIGGGEDKFVVSNPVKIEIVQVEGEGKDKSLTKGLCWVDTETGDKLFGIDDIVRFDWDKQVFELRRRSAMDVLACQKGLSRDFFVADGVFIIYRGKFVSPLSSMTFDCPVIVSRPFIDKESIEAPLFEIQGGYPGTMGKSHVDLRFSERLKKALQQGGVLGEIDLNSQPLPVARDFYPWSGKKGGLRVRVEIFPETFRPDQLLRSHIHVSGIKKREENAVVEVNAKLVAGDGSIFEAHRIYKSQKSGRENIYVFQMNPQGAREDIKSGLKPGPAKLYIDVCTKKILDEKEKRYSEPIESVKMDVIDVVIKPIVKEDVNNNASGAEREALRVDMPDSLVDKSRESNSKLEFRAVGESVISSFVGSSLELDDEQRYKEDLKKNGPGAGWARGDAYVWVEMRDGFEKHVLIIQEYEGKKYLLVCNQQKRKMVADGQWWLQRANAGKDSMGRPAVEFEFDAKGAELFYEFTSNNLRYRVATIVDGAVCSVARVQSAMRDKGIIIGRFSEADVAELVEKLGGGMPMANPKAGVEKSGEPVGDYCLEFDGVDDFLEIQASKSLELGRHFTIQMWIKPDFSDAVNPDQEYALLSKGGHVLNKPDEKGDRKIEPYGFSSCLAPKGESEFTFHVKTAAKRGYLGYDFIMRKSSDWQHLAVVFNGEKGKFYKGGGFELSKDYYQEALKSNLVIGGEAQETWLTNFKGQIGEVRIWNRALSMDEIEEFKTKALTGHEQGLVGCWGFEQGRGDRADDISPYKNRARLGSSYGQDESDPKWVRIGAEK